MISHPNDDAARLAQDEREVFGLLRSLDEPATPPHVAAVVRRARSESRVARYRIAASIALALSAAGVSYAMPGSPVKKWVQAMVAPSTREAPTVPQAVPTPPAMSGIAVVPRARFVIQFAGTSAQSEAIVTLTDDSTLSVRAALGSVSFTSESDRLVIESRRSAISVAIAIPRLAPRVEIQVAGERVFLKNGTSVTAPNAPGVAERYWIPLTPARR